LDIVEANVEHIHDLATKITTGRLTGVCADFYDAVLPERFDVVCYFDGFGIGTDEDQRRLLASIERWMNPSGVALIDVFVPWFWAQLAMADAPARHWKSGTAVGRWDFDADQCRLVGPMWREDAPGEECVQAMRCYSPADLRLLLKGSGLHLTSVQPFNNERYEQRTLLLQAMLYIARLKKVGFE
jgi:SAM-dependent methyltransferase